MTDTGDQQLTPKPDQTEAPAPTVCNCNAMTVPHYHTATGIEAAPAGA